MQRTDVIAAVQQKLSKTCTESLLGGNHPARQLHIPAPLVAEYSKYWTKECEQKRHIPLLARTS